MKTYFMAIPVKQNPFSKLFIGIIILMIVCVFSCTNDAPKEEKKDTMAAPIDTAMKMKTDSGKIDTTGKGGQPVPPAH